MGRVLVVDDDPDILKFCEMVLASHGYEAVTCSNALKALEILRAHAVDLIVIDIVMPQMDGFDLLKEIKKLRNVRSPILMLTGRNATDDVRRAISLGALDYMIKPFDKDLFFAKMQSLMAKRSSGPGQSPPSQRVQFAQASSHARATIGVSGVISSINEMGLVIRTKTYLDRNIKITIDSPIFQEIGVTPPALRTAFCRALEGDREFDFEIHVSFVGLDETAMRKIRRWVASWAIATRKVA